jgi:D-3-phosphoglycerate dehydrogenase
MAAETIRQYIEDGTIRHSVNFPSTNMPNRAKNCLRVTVVNENKTGMLSAITEVFANAQLNIVQQVNHSQGNIAYNVIDVDATESETVNLKELQHDVTMLDGVLSSRVLFATPGVGYARQVDGQYHV